MKQDLDRQAQRINYDKQEFGARIRFCPSCEVRAIQRHERDTLESGKPIEGKEFWCSACGFSFNIRTSVEWNIALRLFKEHRAMRTFSRFQEKYFAPAVVSAWKREYEKRSEERRVGKECR